MIKRKERNSSKTNLVISFIFHTALILSVAFFAAREGILGKKLKQITVTMVPKEKPPEPPKPKPPEPKIEPPKPAEPPKAPPAAPRIETAVAPPPPAPSGAVVPAAAPAPASLPAFEFNDGAKAVETVSDPNAIYKALVEHQLRSRWNRPEDIPDDEFVAEVELTLDAAGSVKSANWVKLTGNARWDASVKAVVAQTKAISRTPPKGFPGTFVARFDVESMRTEPVQVGIR